MSKKTLSEAEETQILDAIAHAEKMTSGEIRVHIESKCKNEVLDRGAEVFFELNMHETKARNGVLIYIALHDKKLAILGDSGINAVVPEGFWDKAKDEMVKHFRFGHYGQGISQAILMAGEQLATYFPYEIGDTNELDNSISKGE
jgi:uncharacterized membrane protein